MKLVYVILIFISLVSAQLEALNIINNENSDININNVVDRYIPEISQIIVNYGLDPLALPQTEKQLWTGLSNVTCSNVTCSNISSNKIESLIYKAKLYLHSGILKYLSHLKRYGDATLNYKERNLKLDANFEFVLLQGKYNYTINLFLFFNLKGGVTISTTSVRAKIIVTFDTKHYTLSLDTFKLEVPGNIKVVVENKKGGVDWINTFIINIVTPFFKNTITNVIEKEATNAIGKLFVEINDVIAKNKLAALFLNII